MGEIMQDLALFSIASERNRWLAARSAAISTNIANADTPGFRARDVAPFESAMDAAALRPNRTVTGHISPDGPADRNFDLLPRAENAGKHSGNTVNLEMELMQLGDVRSQHSMVGGIVSAFHRMLLQSAKG